MTERNHPHVGPGTIFWDWADVTQPESLPDGAVLRLRKDNPAVPYDQDLPPRAQYRWLVESAAALGPSLPKQDLYVIVPFTGHVEDMISRTALDPPVWNVVRVRQSAYAVAPIVRHVLTNLTQGFDGPDPGLPSSPGWALDAYFVDVVNQTVSGGPLKRFTTIFTAPTWQMSAKAGAFGARPGSNGPDGVATIWECTINLLTAYDILALDGFRHGPNGPPTTRVLKVEEVDPATGAPLPLGRHTTAPDPLSQFYDHPILTTSQPVAVELASMMVPLGGEGPVSPASGANGFYRYTLKFTIAVLASESSIPRSFRLFYMTMNDDMATFPEQLEVVGQDPVNGAYGEYSTIQWRRIGGFDQQPPDAIMSPVPPP